MKRLVTCSSAVVPAATVALFLAWGCDRGPGPTAKNDQSAAPAAAAAPDGAVKVRSVRGTVQISSDQSAWTGLRVGSVVPVGSTLKTGEGSTAELGLEDAAMLQVEPQSVVVLESVKWEGRQPKPLYKFHVELREGHVGLRAEEMAPQSTFEVRFAKGGACGVRSPGEFRVSADGTATAKRGSLVMALVKDDGQVTTRVITP